MAFTIEFQPTGVRLDCDKPINGLDAARQAGIELKAVCGGEGTCGKCIFQLLSGTDDYPPCTADKKFIPNQYLIRGYRLACQITIDQDIKIHIPAGSALEGQILQINGEDISLHNDPPVKKHALTLSHANLRDLSSDFSRVKVKLEGDELTAELSLFRELPGILRENDWKADIWTRGNHVFHASPQKDTLNIGLAVDVGSTKIACFLIDLASAKTLTAKGIPNPQISFGEDIMSRLGYAMQGSKQAHELFKLTIDAINQAADEMCQRINLTPDDIADVCIVGNTAMHHFFLNLPTGSLAVSPFVPVTSEFLYPLAEEIGIHAKPGCAVYAPAVTAGFIGSDHLAFLLAAGFGEDTRVRLGIDIGTNTEIALQAQDRIVSVSTASGPAFEGAHIKFGMRAANGAIEHVRLSENGPPDIQVIGDKHPIGICGSGILDVVAQMRAQNILNQRGRIIKTATQVRMDEQGKPEFMLIPGKKPITISQNDVDQILLAKGAIRAGIDILMDYLNITPSDIEEIVIAGAFGSYLLPEHAMGIGMLPSVPLERIKAVGNAAGTGARMMVASTKARKKAVHLANQIEYLELTVYEGFDMFYAQGIRS
jgi:uncharacterized 2Fe-2S/4Fe-4S cluster protein (DUF4445 family)